MAISIDPNDPTYRSVRKRVSDQMSGGIGMSTAGMLPDPTIVPPPLGGTPPNRDQEIPFPSTPTQTPDWPSPRVESPIDKPRSSSPYGSGAVQTINLGRSVMQGPFAYGNAGGTVPSSEPPIPTGPSPRGDTPVGKGTLVEPLSPGDPRNLEPVLNSMSSSVSPQGQEYTPPKLSTEPVGRTMLDGLSGGNAATTSTTSGDPVYDAVAQNYSSLGAQPTGPGSGPTDIAYFVKRINETGGLTDANKAYWFGQNGRIAREMRGEVPPEQAAAETPATIASATTAAKTVPQLNEPSAVTAANINVPMPATMAVNSSRPPNSTSGSNHHPGDGTGVPGVYDWNNAGYPVDAMGNPYRGELQGGEPNPWNTGGGTEGFPADSGPNTPTAPTSLPGPPQVPQTAPDESYQAKIRKQIEARMKELGAPVDENAAGISQAVSAARDEANRAAAGERTALAERLYAQGGGGLNSNALTQQIQQSGENVGIATAGTRANLIIQEYARRQNELNGDYQMLLASGDAEEARKVQMLMAQLQAQLTREGYSIDLAKYTAYLNQQAALSALNG